MTKKMGQRPFGVVAKSRQLLNTALFGSLLPLASGVHALNFQPTDDLSIDIDTTITYGVQVRMDDRDKNILTNTGGIDPSTYLFPNGFGLAAVGNEPGNVCAVGGPTYFAAFCTEEFQNYVQRTNADDGSRNFDQYDLTSNRLAVVSDIDISYKNIGLFTRVQAYYDSVFFHDTSWSNKYFAEWTNLQSDPLNGNMDPMQAINNAAFRVLPSATGSSQVTGDSNSVNRFGDDAQDVLGQNARFLDAYVYGKFDVAGRTLDLRLGRQVISWGEALMLQGGLAFGMNRNDASMATVPGVELKEIFLPTGALYGQIDLTDSLTMEAYWMYEWIPSTLFPTGSFFSMQDFIDGDIFWTHAGLGQFNGANSPGGLATPGVGQAGGFTGADTTDGFMLRQKDVNPQHEENQFGLAFRYLLDNGSELGLYVVNYHDRYPSYWAAGDRGHVMGTNTGQPDSNKYTIEFKDNIRMYGLTLNTVVGDVQLGIELAYRANQPIVPACTFEAVLGGSCKDPSYAALGPINVKSDGINFDNSAQNAARQGLHSEFGIFGWPARAEVTHLNVGFTYIANPTPLWDTATLVGELGMWYVGGWSDDELKFAHLGAFTKYGEGFSMQFMPEYKNVVEGVDITLPLFVNYTIDGSFSFYNYNEKNL
ncbi:MAG: DUF1302 family protein, partial [Pseudomonadales bacterium]|nr:DUF1302 family protein [Pseudomonadales bacterium]